MKTILIIAGEASGDLHGSEIIKAIKQHRSNIRFIGIGGDLMTQFLDRKLADIKDLSVMGLLEVVRHLPRLIGLLNTTISTAIEEHVDAALFIDYPGFNTKLAKSLKVKIPNIKMHQFICPQVWAWRAGRIPELGRIFDTIYCLFDFEPDLFKGYNVEALWVGNPLIEAVATELNRDIFFKTYQLRQDVPLVSLLPGSRLEEVKRLMPPLMQLVTNWQESQNNPVQWIIPVAKTIPEYVLQKYIKHLNIKLIHNNTYAAQAYSNAAIVCSGTATLETALLGTPFVVIYKLNPITYFLAKHLVKLPHFSLVNIINKTPIVTELLQEEVNAKRLCLELNNLLKPEIAVKKRIELRSVKNHLGPPGAANRVAEHLLSSL